MRKSEVYSWRVSSERLQGLERAARSRKRSVSSLLDEIAAEWLAANSPAADQKRIREAAEVCIGSFSTGDPTLTRKTSERVREIIRAKFEREKKQNERGRERSR
jgi:hypothetical protein